MESKSNRKEAAPHPYPLPFEGRGKGAKAKRPNSPPLEGEGLGGGDLKYFPLGENLGEAGGKQIQQKGGCKEAAPHP